MIWEVLDQQLSEEEQQILNCLNSPLDIQSFLDTVQYPAGDLNRSPVRVMHDRQAHCLDGGLFAALALWRLGNQPRIVDILPEPGTDDDHVLAIYQVDGCYGAVAKSNYVGLRFREPVYRSLRELVMSYFEAYYSFDGFRTLRYYTLPLNLTAYAKLNWMWDDAGVDAIERRLGKMKHFPLLSSRQIAQLTPVDRRSYEAGMLGVNPDGLFKPMKKPGTDI